MLYTVPYPTSVSRFSCHILYSTISYLRKQVLMLYTVPYPTSASRLSCYIQYHILPQRADATGTSRFLQYHILPQRAGPHVVLRVPCPDGEAAQEGVQIGVRVLALHTAQECADSTDGASGPGEGGGDTRLQASLPVQVTGLQIALTLHTRIARVSLSFFLSFFVFL
jgi:hypothetical protein